MTEFDNNFVNCLLRFFRIFVKFTAGLLVYMQCILYNVSKKTISTVLSAISLNCNRI